MSSGLECCGKCALRALPHNGPISPFEGAGADEVARHILVLRGRDQPLQEAQSHEDEDRLRAVRQLAAHVCAAMIDSKQCESFDVREVVDTVTHRTSIAVVALCAPPDSKYQGYVLSDD